MHRHRLIRAADTAHTRRHGTGQYASAKVIPPHSWSLETELLKVHIFLIFVGFDLAGTLLRELLEFRRRGLLHYF
jgi:hypothetical protein